MIPADIDPSLSAEPVLETLDDGFSPPHHEDAEPLVSGAVADPQAQLTSKSPF